MDPARVTAADRAASLRFVGTLDGGTRGQFIEAVEQVLRSEPVAVTIDVGKLRLADHAATDALTQAQRMVKAAGATLKWRGVRSEHLQKALTVDRRTGDTLSPLAAWLPSPRFPW